MQRWQIQTLSLVAALMPAAAVLAQPAPAEREKPAATTSSPEAPVPSPTPSAEAPTIARLPGAFWSLTLPKGWEVADAAELEAVNQAAANLAKSAGVSRGVTYQMLIRPEEPDGRYLLVQEGTSLPSGLSFESMTEQIDAGVQAGFKKANKAAAISVEPQRTEIDRDRHRFIIRTAISGERTGSMGSLTVMAFSREHLISVNAYAPAEQFAEAEPSLLEVANSLSIDQGHEYTFGTRSAAGGFDWSQLVAKAGIGGLIGLVVGLVAYLKRRATNN